MWRCGGAALVHDLGRVAVNARIWQKPGPLTADELEQVRLHPYHSERVLARSEFLAALAAVAGAHHERLDGSGYHRAACGRGAGASRAAAGGRRRLPRDDRAAPPYRDTSAPPGKRRPREEANAGRLDVHAVTAVLEAGGQQPPRIKRPAGLTEREAEVVAMLARGLQTK